MSNPKMNLIIEGLENRKTQSLNEAMASTTKEIRKYVIKLMKSLNIPKCEMETTSIRGFRTCRKGGYTLDDQSDWTENVLIDFYFGMKSDGSKAKQCRDKVKDALDKDGISYRLGVVSSIEILAKDWTGISKS